MRFILSVLLAVVLAGVLSRPARAANRPNILLILADDLGYGDVACYNSEGKIPTPAIDKIAAEGTRFTDAHSPASVCVPTRYALLTGRYPFRRPKGNGSFDGGPLIGKQVPTLPGLLRSKGYHTAMVGKWHLGFKLEGFDGPLSGGPVDRGFETYFGVPASTDIPPYFFIEQERAVDAPTATMEASHSAGVRRIQGAFWREGKIAPGLKLEEVLPTLADRADNRLRELANSEKPFFLYVALTAPHTPWLPTDQFENRSQIGGAGVPEALSDYGGFVTQVDHIVGCLMKTLEESGATHDTLVIFTSDNGPTWYETDVARTGHDSAGPWRGMKGDAWEAGHRVPFVVRWPGHVPAGHVSNELICQIDLMATFAALLNTKLPENAALDSQDLSALLLGEEGAKGRETLVTQASSGTLSLRQGRYKFIPQLGSAGFSKPRRIKPKPGGPTAQFYDLKTDPDESHNLAAEHFELVRSLRSSLESIQQSERTR